MANSASVAGFKVSLEADDAATVEKALSALRDAQESILREGKMLFVQCQDTECPASILGLLSSWDYEAIARIPASGTLCFAKAESVAARLSARKRKPARDSFVRFNLDVVRERATSRLKQNPVYRGARNLALDFRGLRPASLRARKLHKLLVSPEKFLLDSSHPILAGPGLWALQAFMPDDALVRTRKDVTAFDFPKRTLLVCAGADCEIDVDAIAACSRELGLRTELVVLVSSVHAKVLPAMLATVHCPRVRMYIMTGGTGEDMLRYGLARSYATNVAAIALPTSCDSESLDRGFSLLTRDNDHFFDSAQGAVGARREVWRDYLAGERDDPDLKSGVSALLMKLTPPTTDAVAALPRTESLSDYSQYPGIDSLDPFTSQGDAPPRISCFDRKPVWPRPGSASFANHELLVTVIMTVYNAADTVLAAIDSVLDQTYQNFELLVIDDCSPDDSLRVLKEKAAKDDRIRVLQTARNSGTYYAKNVGLRFARGAFVTFHDSDDVSSLNRLELQAQALSADPDAIGNYTRYQRLSESGDEVWLNGRTNRPGYITLMIRRVPAMEATGFFDSVRVSADAEYVERLKIATGRDVRLLPVVSYYALQAEGSLTTSGAAAFGVDAEGRSTMPLVRQVYRDAARRWHGQIFDGMSSAVMPFPLSERAFAAPREIRPDRGNRDE